MARRRFSRSLSRRRSSLSRTPPSPPTPEMERLRATSVAFSSAALERRLSWRRSSTLRSVLISCLMARFWGIQTRADRALGWDEGSGRECARCKKPRLSEDRHQTTANRLAYCARHPSPRCAQCHPHSNFLSRLAHLFMLHVFKALHDDEEWNRVHTGARNVSDGHVQA